MMRSRDKKLLTIYKATRHVKYRTDNVFYDTSYRNLLIAGRNLMEDASCLDSSVLLATGLLAWNQGAKHSLSMERLADISSRKHVADLVKGLRAAERAVHDGKGSALIVENCLSLARAALGGMASVTIPSKLLHFMAPRIFTMVDSRVEACFPRGATVLSSNGYIELVILCWDLSLHEESPRDLRLVNFWEANDECTPLRALDCTLYRCNSVLLKCEERLRSKSIPS